MLKRKKMLSIAMILTVTLCLGIVGTAFAGETPLEIDVIGPYGNFCSFDEFGTHGTIMWQLISCSLGFNAHIY